MNEMCNKVHQLFNGMKRFHFPFDENQIPENGIYILFENGEKTHGGDRIVRIGINKKNGNLRLRLKSHIIENKDGSVFRTHIGTCFLNKENDNFWKIWDKHMAEITIEYKEKKKKTEERVTKYIQENFSFVVFEVSEENKRLEIESRIISTVSLCDECKPSENWLGLFSPKDKIRESGLWLVNELYKEPLQDDDFKELQKLVKI